MLVSSRLAAAEGSADEPSGSDGECLCARVFVCVHVVCVLVRLAAAEGSADGL